jgi:hypothetical protein
MVLREGVSKKHKDIKLDFKKFCTIKAHEYLAGDVNNIKKNLQNDIYDSIEKFKEDIDTMKSRFMENGPVFSGRKEILLDECLSLSLRASDNMLNLAKKDSTSEARRVKEKND